MIQNTDRSSIVQTTHNNKIKETPHAALFINGVMCLDLMRLGDKETDFRL